ncbi:MAG: multicopper oxidase domain-containing protein, partial [Chloroflexi bacterium]|nr:multicopper oxidase domain-containing protein [Chloroflexota bacterium]
ARGKHVGKLDAHRAVLLGDELTFMTVPGYTMTLPMQPKAIQDEMGEAYDEYGRMRAAFGVEMPGTMAGMQNFILYGYLDPATEIIQDSITPMSPVAGDGTQIWKITHNGVDTHPVHFHLFNVQLINRVGWDGAIRLPDQNELGWKDTVRVSPLEDTIVALRPVAPKIRFGVPESVRPYDVTRPLGSTMGFRNADPLTGNPITVINSLFNFGWEFVWHCHILGHEENDMMRPIVFKVQTVPPAAPTLTRSWLPGGPVNLTWTDATPALAPNTLGNPANEIGFRVERAMIGSTGSPGAYSVIATALANATTYSDATAFPGVTYSYRVTAFNAAGSGVSNAVIVAQAGTAPAAPTNLRATLQSGPRVRLTWRNNASNATDLVIERSDNGGAFTPLAGVPPINNTGAVGSTGSMNYTDTTVTAGNAYAYRVKAMNGALSSGYSNTASASVPNVPAAPSGLAGTAVTLVVVDSVKLNWTNNATNATSLTIQRSTGDMFSIIQSTRTVAANTTTFQEVVSRGGTYYYRIRANNLGGSSAWSNTATVVAP